MEQQSWSSRLDPGTGAQEHDAAVVSAPSDRRRRAQRVKGLVALLLLVVLGAVSGRMSQATWRTDSAAVGWSSWDGGRPTATAPPAARPLGTPQDVPGDAGRYTFMSTQPGSAAPVAYDPCRPLHYVVNAAAAPPGGDRLVAEAVAVMQSVTGLQFEFEGLTDEPASEERPAFQPDRYGDRWAPVLIAWTDPTVVSTLEGDIAGIGGSTAFSVDGREDAAYVTGTVMLDAPQLGADVASLAGAARARSVILHELAHVVGLDHVDDPTQLMHAAGGGAITGFQPGDLAGLAQLGRGKCISRL